MTPLLLVAGLLAAMPVANAATITTSVAATSGPETCVSTITCEVFSDAGTASANSFVNPNFLSGGLLSVQGWFAGVTGGFEGSPVYPMSVYSFASLTDIYMPFANGYAVFEFWYFGFSDIDHHVDERAEFNGLPLIRFAQNRFKIPVVAEKPFTYTIEIEASISGTGGPIGRPRGFLFEVFPNPIAFLPTPEPGSAAMLMLAGGFLAWRLRRQVP